MSILLSQLLADCRCGIGMTARNVPKVMDGSKTQTRRIFKMKNLGVGGIPDGTLADEVIEFRQQDGTWFGLHGYDTLANAKSYQVGDLLYIKEALERQFDTAAYKTCGTDTGRLWQSDDGKPWKNSVIPARYMPRSAARTVIEITDVRCERIQGISVGDIMAEGCRLDSSMQAQEYRDAFKELWNETNGKDAWERNDWVFAYTFKVANDQGESQ